MKIEITKGKSPLAEVFASPPSVEGEADYQKLMFVEELLALMKQQNISRGELARRMQVQPSRITSMLSGSNNFTIETMVRAARAVGAKYHGRLTPASKTVHWQIWETTEAHTAPLHAESADKKAAEVTFEILSFSHDDAAAAA
jgi:plasmid maintenance system antidote protein VapI